MIDWTTVIVPFAHDRFIRGGIITSTTDDGEIEWETNKGYKIEGSHDSGILVKTSTSHVLCSQLWISGNPSKFLQGHNVYGSDDLCRLVADMTARVVKALGYTVEDEQYMSWRQGDFQLKTVDINYMRPCGSRENARAMLKRAQHTGCMRHSGRGEFSGSTLYFAKKSRRRAIKMYVKGDELEHGGRKHQLSSSLGEEKIQELKAIADDALRIELRLHSLELKDLRLQDGKAWCELDVKELFDRYVEKIEFSANESLTRDKLLSLPKHLQRTYALWKEGVDIRTLLKPATYYRQRRDLLGYDVDIGATCAA